MCVLRSSWIHIAVLGTGGQTVWSARVELRLPAVTEGIVLKVWQAMVHALVRQGLEVLHVKDVLKRTSMGLTAIQSVSVCMDCATAASLVMGNAPVFRDTGDQNVISPFLNVQPWSVLTRPGVLKMQ